MGRPAFGMAVPGAQQVPGRCEPWEAATDGRDVVRVAQAAEAAGFDWVSCSDHPLVPATRAETMGRTWLDAGSTLAFVGGATSRIRLLSHVLVVPYRHPLVVAKQWGTLDHLSGGRVVLGVGSGHVKPEFGILGADYPRRGLVTDEFLAAIAAAWEQDPAGFDGETLRFRDVIVAPRPAQQPRPPFWVGGNSMAAVRRAARLGEGWIPWELAREDFRAKVARLRTLRAEAGRSDPIDLIVPLVIAADAESARLQDAVAEWGDAGATGFHLGIRAASLPAFIERLEWVGDVLDQAG